MSGYRLRFWIAEFEILAFVFDIIYQQSMIQNMKTTFNGNSLDIKPCKSVSGQSLF